MRGCSYQILVNTSKESIHTEHSLENFVALALISEGRSELMIFGTFRGERLTYLAADGRKSNRHHFPCTRSTADGHRIWEEPH